MKKIIMSVATAVAMCCADFPLINAAAGEADGIDPVTNVSYAKMEELKNAWRGLPAGFQADLNTFLADPEVQEVFFRPAIYTFDEAYLLKQGDSFAPELKAAAEAGTLTEGQKESLKPWWGMWVWWWNREKRQTLYAKYGIEELGNWHVAALRFNKWPQYVFKFLVNKWVHPFQLVSSVLYADTMNKLIRENHLEEVIVPPELMVYQIPGKGTDFTDENYIIVGSFIESLPSEEENLKRCASLLSDNEHDRTLVAALAKLVKEAGLWDVRAHKIMTYIYFMRNSTLFLVGDPGHYRAVFLHLECPGKASYVASDFYRKTPDRIAQHANAGLVELKKLLPTFESVIDAA